MKLAKLFAFSTLALATLATLTAAKIGGHRVHVTTDNTDGCGLLSGGTYAKMVYLATNP